MTVIEFRLFFDSLPGNLQSLSGRPIRKTPIQQLREQNSPDKNAFLMECGIKKIYLTRILKGKKSLTEYIASKVLPVMHKYGFQGK